MGFPFRHRLATGFRGHGYQDPPYLICFCADTMTTEGNILGAGGTTRNIVQSNHRVVKQRSISWPAGLLQSATFTDASSVKTP